MKSVKKQILTIAALIFAVFISWSINHLFFSSSHETAKAELEAKFAALQEYRGLLSRKDVLKKTWEEEQGKLSSSQNSSESLNLWVKDLVSRGEAGSIRFDKLEPHESKKEISVSLAFQGEIKKFVHFLYGLLEKDPASKLEALSVKTGESRNTLVYEMTLARPAS